MSSDDLFPKEASLEEMIEMGILPKSVWVDYDNFFCITMKTPENAFDIMLMLSTYNPLFRTLRCYEEDVVMLVVYANGDSDEAKGDLRLAEMACQMNYRQTGSIVCPICSKKGDTSVCGHLTFEV